MEITHRITNTREIQSIYLVNELFMFICSLHHSSSMLFKNLLRLQHNLSETFKEKKVFIIMQQEWNVQEQIRVQKEKKANA